MSHPEASDIVCAMHNGGELSIDCNTSQFSSCSSAHFRVAEVQSRTEVRTSNCWTKPASSGAGSPGREIFENQFKPQTKISSSVDCTMSITSTSIRPVEKLAIVSVERNNQAVSPKAMGDTTPIMIGRTCGECCLYDIETTLVPSCILFPPIFFYLIHGHISSIRPQRNQY